MYLPWGFHFLSYTPHDWYLLTKLAIYQINDKDTESYFWQEDGDGFEVEAGPNLRTLLHAIANGYF